MNKQDEADSLEFIDLANIQNISDLNKLAELQNRAKSDLQSPLDVENIALDLDEDELEQMQRMIGHNVGYKEHRGIVSD